LHGLDLARDVYGDPAERARVLALYADRDSLENVETQWKRRDGTLITVKLSGRKVRNAAGEVVGFEAIAENITERRELEEQLHRAQKLEAVGRLAGGWPTTSTIC
jgi:PAS domain S-box-containing protein